MTSSACLATEEDLETEAGLVSTSGPANRGALESNVGLLNTSAPGRGVGPWSTCDPWSIDDLGMCDGPVVVDAPGNEDVQQIEAVHLREFGLRRVTCLQRRRCNPGVDHFAELEHGPGTWLFGHGEVSAFAATVAVKTATEEGPAINWMVGAGFGVAAAADPDAGDQKHSYGKFTHNLRHLSWNLEEDHT